MAIFRIFHSLPFILWLTVYVAATALQPATRIRTAPGQSIHDTYNAIKRNLAAASLDKRQEYKAEIPLAKSWQDASLIQLGVGLSQTTDKTDTDIGAGIEVKCKHCYVRGNAIAVLEIEDNFNISQAVDKTINDTKQEFDEFGNDIVTYLDQYVSKLRHDLGDGFDLADFDLPTFERDFNLSIPAIPESSIRFQFDGMELYMEMETIISAGATYEINLFSSKSPYGFKIKELQLGFVLTIDLILSVNGEVDISSGFHIKLDDGVSMAIPLFGDSVSDIKVDGGQFEFLPVTVQSAGVVLQAALRVGVSCGIVLPSPDLPTMLDVLNFGLDTGMEVAIYANIAEFITHITHVPDDKDCSLQVVQEYNFVLGAIAGASIEVNVPMLEQNLIAAAVAEATTAVFTTTLADVCAMSKTTAAPTASITSGVAKREDLSPTVVSTEITYSGISCNETGIGNCPVTAQVSIRSVVTKTYTASYSELTLDHVGTTVPFGNAAQSIQTMSGSPTQYTAAPTSSGGVVSGKVSKKLIIGVSVGVGVPLLLALIGGLVFLRQKRRTSHGVSFVAPAVVADPYAGRSDEKNGDEHAKGTAVNVHEVQK